MDLQSASRKAAAFASPVAAAALVFTAIGRFRKGGLDWEDFTSSYGEYSFHIFAGLFFGWALGAGLAGLLQNGKGKGYIPLCLIAVAAPIVFLITIHQTRNMFNDGPATMTMAAGTLIHYVFIRFGKTGF